MSNERGGFDFDRKNITKKKFRFNYIWKSSIPNSWEKIFQKKGIEKFNIGWKSRNTMDFLEETQKYIREIRPVFVIDKIEISPNKFKFSQEKRVLNEGVRGFDVLEPISIRKGVMKKKLPKIEESEIYRICRSHNQSPSFNNFDSPVIEVRQLLGSKKTLISNLKL